MGQKEKTIDIQLRAIGIIRLEKTAWEDAVAFVTDKVAFSMRNLIRQLRKNYWGIFETPTDPITGRDKIWNPLTESLVEAAVKSIDLDTKDINFRAKQSSAIPLTNVIRSAVKVRLDQINFGQTLDEMLRNLAIDGTAVWRTMKVKDENGKPTIKIIPIDLLNIYIDPSVESIQSAYRFTTRNLVFKEDILKEKDWINQEDAVARTGLSFQDTDLLSSSATTGTTKMVDLWEMWGKIPKSLITGKKSDDKIEIDGHIILSGMDMGGSPIVHLIEGNKKGIKPYEEFWYTKVSNRWHGRGVAEKIMWLQLWMNTITNIRITRSYISQLGIFKIRKNSGISPKMIGRLSTNGALIVKNMDDIEQFVTQDLSGQAINEESNIMSIAQRVTSAFDIAIGAPLPASTSATASAIQNQNAQSSFVLIKEGVGLNLQKWLKRQAIPVIMKGITAGEILRLTGEPEMVRAFDERIVNSVMYEAIDKANKEGFFLDPVQVENERQSALEKLRRSGSDRFVEIKNSIDYTKYDVQVFITNEEIDKGVMLQNLIASLNLAPEFRDPILRTVFDLMGLDSNILKSGTIPQLNAGTSPAPQSQIPSELVTASNTLSPNAAR